MVSAKPKDRHHELKEICSKGLIKGEIKFMEPMRNHTSLRIGGPADIFLTLQDMLSLRNLLSVLKKNNEPFFPLGGGTNILVKDGGIEGVVLSLKSFRRIGVIREEEKYLYMSVEAGTPLQRLVHFSKEKGYSGIEGLAGIPGTLGGAICGNAGAFGYEIKDILVSVQLMNAEGMIKSIKANEIEFAYRSSSILPSEVILAAEIRLRSDRKDEVSARIEDFLGIKREKQPIWERSAGCVFKNPDGLSAGKLIEEAGCKGLRIGDVEVNGIHANFFVNKGNAKASDFLKVMEEVVRRVKERFEIMLEPEIRIVGRDVADS